MSKVDWSLAPDWCKSFGLIGISKFEVWFDDHYYEYLHDGNKHAFDDGCTYKRSAISFSEERPRPTWSGPQDGLPPIGLEVDFIYRGCPQGTGKVLFYGNEFCIVQNTTGGAPYEQVAEIEDYSFTAICDVEQLAAEQRETAIREIMDIADVDCRVTAARLVDAGFKREVV